MPNSKQADLIILGAGASGLMCAATAAKRGLNVLVLEKANKVGKKILMSGGGKCNFTNYDVSHQNYISHNEHFCKSALNQYTQWDFFSLVNEYAIAWEERKHGQLFCLDSAKDILNMLLEECESAQGKVEIISRCENMQLSFEHNNYQVNCSEISAASAQVVIATGALSIPTLGGSDFGYDVAEQFSLTLTPRRAGLVPFTFTDNKIKPFCEALSGLALDVEVSCNNNSFRENLLFTHRGMSGPVMLQISNYWHKGDSLSINLLPDIDAGDALLALKSDSGTKTLKQWLNTRFSKKLTQLLSALLFDTFEQKSLAEISDKDIAAIGQTLNAWQIKPADTEGYRTAEVTLGGVSTDELSSKTMESKKQPGLYFIGEVVDVSGHLGGFNFQWAWSSAFACGQHVKAPN